MDDLIARGLAGNPVDALKAAYHLNRVGESGEPVYRALLEIMLAASDPELLVDVGERLFLGDGLARDIERARDFFLAADKITGFMGSFVLAGFIYRSEPRLARKLLARGKRFGHIPSIFLINQLALERHQKLAPVLRPMFFVLGWWSILRTSWNGATRWKFWRFHKYSSSKSPWVDARTRIYVSPISDLDSKQAESR